MIDTFMGFDPWLQALVATLFTWTMTGLGAAVVFLTREVNDKFLDMMLGFAGGVMIAASFWSLLAPAIENSQNNPIGEWFPAAVGFLLGGLFIYGFDKLIPHAHRNSPESRMEGWRAERKRRSTLLVFSLTLHNIPEGLAIGIAFGALASNADPAAVAAGAATLALGIGIQNIPEGMAVSMPLRGEGMSRTKSFFFGWMSGIVEPMAAVIGIIAISFMSPVLPYALALAAGAMIFVVVEEVIPSTQKNGHSDIAVMCLMLGFTLMMILDVALG
ncbi:ZIP family metal transporter [Salinicoccus sp. ID82-1]|uniref:ZIP family metal transporter n=1 Tax=Salinicoccus cyprini TaxID=2493691 RepID=A0A558AS11_9STAP|nr:MULTISPECIES: ZIP family metal transporter [Salinicoccus]MCG1009623.1 ZIP family metal transporter [Salinicoccus sp. ID82-1]TVT27055.1 ZIP family metal transporter [Salinicoccus cyprini]